MVPNGSNIVQVDESVFRRRKVRPRACDDGYVLLDRRQWHVEVEGAGCTGLALHTSIDKFIVVGCALHDYKSSIELQSVVCMVTSLLFLMSQLSHIYSAASSWTTGSCRGAAMGFRLDWPPVQPASADIPPRAESQPRDA